MLIITFWFFKLVSAVVSNLVSKKRTNLNLSELK
nr:MAG TPA: hypothetical protein [Caudoviricetes sp.]